MKQSDLERGSFLEFYLHNNILYLQDISLIYISLLNYLYNIYYNLYNIKINLYNIYNYLYNILNEFKNRFITHKIYIFTYITYVIPI